MDEIIFGTYSVMLIDTPSIVGGSVDSYSYDGPSYDYISGTASGSSEISWSYIN